MEERLSSKASSHSAGSSVAFDLGANAVRVVEVDWSGSGGGGRLVKRGSAALPVNVWNDLPTHSAAFVGALKQAMSNAGISAKVVSASLPRRLVTLRFARLPHAPPEAMRGLVAFEAQQYVLFPLDEVILDYHVATDGPNGLPIPSEDDMESVLLAAARRSLITDLIAIFEKAGLELDQLTVSALALAEHIRDSIEATAVIDVEPGEMDVAVVANRQLLFTRASGLDVIGAQPDIAARRLADEVARSFTSFQNEYRQQVLTHINLTGPSVQGAEGMAVEQTLSSVLEMPISTLATRLMPAGDTDAIAYATAIGVALQTRPGNLASINLVPDERAIKKAMAAQRQRKQLAAIGGILAAGVVAFVVQRAVSASRNEQIDRLAANEKLRKLTTTVDAKRKVFQTQKSLFEELNTGLDREHPAIDVLVALNRALPQTTDIWLTQFAFDRSGLITLHGETKSATAATDMVLALQASGAFTDVKVAYLGDAQENNVASSPAPAPAPAAATVATPITVAPLAPPMASANSGGPGFNRMGGGSPGGPTGSAPGGAATYPGSGPGGPGRGFQPPVNYQPGQGFPGGLPPGVVIQPPQGPGAQATPAQTPAQIYRRQIEADSPRQPVAAPLPATPPFYLIGYGQDPTVAQDPNAAGSSGQAGQDGSDPNARRNRRRNRGQNGWPGQGQGSAMPNPGVTPGGPGSSNQIQPGSMPMGQIPQGRPTGPQGGPVINPTVPATRVVVPKPAPPRRPALPLSGRPKSNLTSFIITCRLNPQAHTLLTSPAFAPAKGGKRTQTAAPTGSRRPIGEGSDTEADNGGETDGNP
jgi:Tfp pilus assembly PilM family ATPase/Tfp pilus assembly protein PilN